MTKTEFKRMASSIVRIYFATMIGQIIASGVGIFDIDGEGWKAHCTSGVASVLLVVYAYLNPKDPRFGKGKDVEIVDKE